MKSITLPICLVFISFFYAQDLELELFASNLDRPVNINHASDDRLFVVEQDGLIKIVNANGSVEPTPFLDIDSRVRSTGNEQGLLGLAFHPAYTNNGYFFVNYINNNRDSVIARFSRDATNPSLADPNSKLIILDFDQPFSNHNGGELAFGGDGYLYIATGDGGSGCDPRNNSQTLSNLLGKMLRIDVYNSTVANPYDIPADNPFVGDTSVSDETWSYGLRNPWKFSFDRNTNDFCIADVGQNAKEKINLTPAPETGGLNYGWRCYEGNSTFNTSNCPGVNMLTFPVSDYAHSNGRCSITGGYVYRGSIYPNFQGLYFFADACSQEIGYLRFENSSWNATFENFSGGWVALGEDINGELLVSSLSGNIFKLTDANLSIDETTLNAVSIFPNPTNTELYLDFSQAHIEIQSVIILDLQGRPIKNIERTQQIVQSIDVAAFPEGIYVLKMTSSVGKSSNQKLVIK